MELAGKRAQVSLMCIIQNYLITSHKRQVEPSCRRDQNAVSGIAMESPRQEGSFDKDLW